RDTIPHAGYELLLKWARAKHHGAFVYTSNVDGQFQAAGFDEARIVECHGSIHRFQCARACTPAIWAAPPSIVPARPPRCPRCGGSARPNFLLFSDPAWIVARTNSQRLRMEVWRMAPIRPVVIEIGAGVALPSVRMFAESLRLPLVRINTHDSDNTSASTLSLHGTALDILRRIDDSLTTQVVTTYVR
ncbi:SIR2 family NAD-dependent protein deacylase, partial [Paraburkholderia sp. J67]|uniref:SIR2 family NAD-dependent protein deacylase n=1 Tax=Paraburkholderia sp. J67 TaxID=2805435 RepID=UPI002ABD2B0C